MAIINAKQFCKKTGFPLATLRLFCREGKISHWRRGRVYWLDESTAIAELDLLKNRDVYKRETNHRNRHTGVLRRNVLTHEFNYSDEISRLKRKAKELN